MSKGENMATVTDRPTFAAYVRVSTDGQAESGLGLEAQRDALRRWAAYRGAELAWYEDAGESASKVPLARRPAGARMVADIAAGRVAGVAAAKLDRLFRDAAETLTVSREWDRAGAALVLLDLAVDTGTPMGRAFLTMAAAFAELEAARIGERTRDGLAAARAAGATLGGEAFGWARTEASDDAGRREVIAVDAEAATVERIIARRAAGASYATIAAELAGAGVPSKRGGRWTAMTIRRIALRAEGAAQ